MMRYIAEGVLAMKNKVTSALWIGVWLICLSEAAVLGMGIGDTVKVTADLNVRTGPGTNYPEITDADYPDMAPPGTVGKIVAGPQSGSGYTWWRVDFGSGQYSGWSIQNGLQVTSSAQPTTATATSVTLTLYIHEGSANGPLVQGVKVTGQDGTGNGFDQTTSSGGLVVIAGKLGNWKFTAAKTSYQTNSWSQDITATCTKHAFVQAVSQPQTHPQPSVATPTPQKPAPPALISPVNGAPSEPLSPIFQWKAVPGADYYGLYISKPPYGPANVVYDQEGINGNTMTLPSGRLENEVKYIWNMRSHNSVGWGSFSESRSFTTVAKIIPQPQNVVAPLTPQKPAPPTPTSPGSPSEPGQTIDTLTPTLQWNNAPSADYYALAISEYPYGTAHVVHNPQQIRATSYPLPTGVLKPGSKYRWNMQACVSGQWSNISNTLYFQTKEQPKAVPVTTTTKALPLPTWREFPSVDKGSLDSTAFQHFKTIHADHPELDASGVFEVISIAEVSKKSIADKTFKVFFDTFDKITIEPLTGRIVLFWSNGPYISTQNQRAYIFSYKADTLLLKDWVDYLASIRVKYRPIGRLTIYAHGNTDRVFLIGQEPLSIEQLGSKTTRDQLERLKTENILTPNAHILLFSCLVGQDEGFIQELANITGAWVHANRELTGYGIGSPSDYKLETVKAPQNTAASVVQTKQPAAQPKAPTSGQLSPEEQRRQAAKLWEKVEKDKKLMKVVLFSEIAKKRLVDNCRQIIRKFPDSEYASKAKEALANLSEKDRKRFGIKDQKIK